jgi:hypothetical protein
MSETKKVCEKCDIEMVRGQALEDKMIVVGGVPDFPGQPESYGGQTMTLEWDGAKLSHVWKCPKCGRSIA